MLRRQTCVLTAEAVGAFHYELASKPPMEKHMFGFLRWGSGRHRPTRAKGFRESEIPFMDDSCKMFYGRRGILRSYWASKESHSIILLTLNRKPRTLNPWIVLDRGVVLSPISIKALARSMGLDGKPPPAAQSMNQHGPVSLP